VAFIDRSTRVGRSQGASIFWGLVSVCFAAAACFYYLKNHDNERAANQMRDQAMQLREENESLASQKDHLQEAQAEAASQLKTREDLVAQKETELAAEETRLDSLDQQSQIQSQGNLAQVAVVKKFNDIIRKLGKDQPDVVERGGRPVLRVPNAQLFAVGDAALTPDGKTMLGQLAQALNDQLTGFELRIVTYTDTDAEGVTTSAPKKDDAAKPVADSDSVDKPKPHIANSWDLTAARAAAIARYLRDQTQLPFLSVLVIGRGDSEPIASNAGDNHARNRRVEITVAPMPVAFHPPEADKADATPPAKTSAAPATATPAPAKKEKPKDTKPDTKPDQSKPTVKKTGH
jgi:chemotaxis protein MotB